jgi:hypothetical protein
MSASAYTQRIRSRVQAKSSKIQYSNNSVGTDIIFNGVVPCSHIDTNQISYEDYKYCIFIQPACDPSLIPSGILNGGTPFSAPAANCFTLVGSASGFILSGGDVIIRYRDKTLNGGIPSINSLRVLSSGDPASIIIRVLNGGAPFVVIRGTLFSGGSPLTRFFRILSSGDPSTIYPITLSGSP